MSDTIVSDHSEDRQRPTFHDLFQTFGAIGLLSFGGPAAQIALMHRKLVEEQEWLDERAYLDGLGFCMLLPGPEAMQLATYAGWRLRGTLGGLLAGLLFVLPGAAIILAIATVYAFFGDVPLVNALFVGVKSAVLIIVVEALLRVSKRALKGTASWLIATGAFIAIFFFTVPYPLIVLAAGLIGFVSSSGSTPKTEARIEIRTSVVNTMTTILVWLAIWWLPVLVLARISDHAILTELGTFFSKLAVVTFGGAYAVLAYMAQDVVAGYGWLNASEMMDGLGLAETTPGPLILVTEFVGFIAAFREGGPALGLAGALVTLWVTFAPCFLWIFAGAPYIEWIAGQKRLAGALAGITAAVVGVILNLSIWFGLHVLFGSIDRVEVGPLILLQPVLNTLDWRVAVLVVAAGVMLLKLHWGIARVLLLSSLLGWIFVSL